MINNESNIDFTIVESIFGQSIITVLKEGKNGVFKSRITKYDVLTCGRLDRPMYDKTLSDKFLFIKLKGSSGKCKYRLVKRAGLGLTPEGISVSFYNEPIPRFLESSFIDENVLAVYQVLYKTSFTS